MAGGAAGVTDDELPPWLWCRWNNFRLPEPPPPPNGLLLLPPSVFLLNDLKVGKVTGGDGGGVSTLTGPAPPPFPLILVSDNAVDEKSP